jgi:type VI secretion system protein ImpJ
MLNLPVCWSEGMFLRPQHFQASDRFWTEVIGQSSRLDVPYNYGFAAIVLEKDAIGRGEFGLQRAAFRLRDGTVWNLDDGQCPGRVSLRAALDQQESVDVLIGIANLQSWQNNTATNEGDLGARYSLTEATKRDENGSGDPQPVELRRPNFRLMLSTEDQSGYETLPVARVRRSGDGQAVAVLDETYIPPLLNAATWPELSVDIVRALHDQMARKLDVLADQIRATGLGFGAQEPGELERMMFLHQLNEHTAALGTIHQAAGVHPFVVYLELVRILGALSIFLPERVAGAIKPYDHNELGEIFGWVRNEIVRRLEYLVIRRYETSLFVGTPRGMEAGLRRRWLEEKWAWYVGAQTTDISSQELITLLTSPSFQWVLASASRVDQIFNTLGQGLILKALTQVPSPLPGQQGWTYFEITKDGPVWEVVRREQTLSMRFQVGMIEHQEQLPGSRRIELKARNQTARVKFCLFAVPTD